MFPPQTDHLSDNDELDDNNFEGSLPIDVPGTVEIHHDLGNDIDDASNLNEWVTVLPTRNFNRHHSRYQSTH